LLAAATIAYLGPVTGDFRAERVTQWLSTIQSSKLAASPDYSLQRLLGEPVTIREWNIAGLPSDSFSVDNGIIATCARRWPLMIDPQGQASKWIKNMMDSSSSGADRRRHLVVVKPGDRDCSMRF
jgi:dynein heavy chain